MGFSGPVELTRSRYFSHSIKQKNMADFVMVYFHLVAAFIIDIIALQHKIFAQGSIEATQAIQVTVSSTQSVAILMSVSPTQTATENGSSQIECPDGHYCRDLGVSCINCTMNYSCIYGKDTEAQCVVYSLIKCRVRIS